jgi:NitT/TauT family transport system permease protein
MDKIHIEGLEKTYESKGGRTPLAFAALVSLTVMSIALYYGIVFIERIAVPWAPKN